MCVCLLYSWLTYTICRPATVGSTAKEGEREGRVRRGVGKRMSRQCQAIVLCFECFGAFALFGCLGALALEVSLLCSALRLGRGQWCSGCMCAWGGRGGGLIKVLTWYKWKHKNHIYGHLKPLHLISLCALVLERCGRGSDVVVAVTVLQNTCCCYSYCCSCCVCCCCCCALYASQLLLLLWIWQFVIRNVSTLIRSVRPLLLLLSLLLHSIVYLFFSLSLYTLYILYICIYVCILYMW